jgi:S1 RNA binding domain protein
MQPKVGEIVEVKITGITKFGVFVDLGEGQSGMVHISEVAKTYVNEISDFVKVGDTVKAKILNIGDDGKISLSIKRALDDTQPKNRARRAPAAPNKPDNSFVWTSSSNEGGSFEDMLKKFQQTSDEKFSELKRKNMDIRRSKRGAASK